jgi:sec-independent protein translocase protein TatC
MTSPTIGEKRLTILGHIAELRTRLIRSVIAVVVATGIAFGFGWQLVSVLTYESPFVKPAFDFLTTRAHLFAPPTIDFVAIELTEPLGVYMKVSLVAGIVLAMPYLLYEFCMFVSPALTRQERRRFIYTGVPFMGIMFIIGVLFAYFVLMPPALKFLVNFGNDVVTAQIRISNYITLVSRLILAVGLIFELPVVTSLLARMGIVSYRWLAKQRRWAIIGAFVVGAIITPTLDPVNQTLVSVPIILLYEMSIWLAFLVGKREKAAAQSETA